MNRSFSRRDVLALGLGTCITVACGGDAVTAIATTPNPVPTPTPGPAATLTVMNGIQAATQTPGALLDVFANADPVGQVFDKWTGSTTLLTAAGERRSGTMALAASSSVSATYKALAAFTPSTKVLNGVPANDPAAVNAYWFFPSSLPRGVVFRFHGSGGNGATQFTKVEELKFARDAVGSGFAVVSLDSADRINRSWDPLVNQTNPGANTDVANIQSLIAMFITQGLMTPGTPVFGSGHSAGAGAALRFSFLLNWKASHQHCVPGTTQIAQGTLVPGIWTMAQNDTLEDPSRNASAKVNSDFLAARGIVTSYIVVAPSAVYLSRFTQIPGVTATDSVMIYNALKTAKLLSDADYQVTDPNLVNLTPVIPPQYASFAKDIQDQLFVAYAAHQFSSATSRRVLDFFIARL